MEGIQESKEQEKHAIAVLTECDLYKRIKGFDEDSQISKEEKEKGKTKIIEAFVEFCVERFQTLTPDEIRQHVLYVLNRTIENIERLNNER